MTRPPFLLLSALLPLAGCADDTTPRAAPELSPSVEVRPGVRLDRLLAARGDAAPLVAVMRAPRSRRAEAVANVHVAGQTDSVVTLVYDGLAVEAWVAAGGPTLIRRVAVTEGTYGTVDGLSVGEARADVEAVLGRPTRQAAGVVSYVLGGPLPTTVEVRYAPDGDGTERAAEIVWRLPID